MMKDVLRGAQPEASEILEFILEPEPDFVYYKVVHDTKQCIPRSNAAAATEHSVDMADVKNVHLSCPGTPIIDGHVNLSVGQSSRPVLAMTLFLQYKHSVSLVGSEAVKVSLMNQAVTALRERLSRHLWPMARQWALLWVTNRSVIIDAEPDAQLLWVGREQLCEHAPLIGMRGLVAVEEFRQAE